MKRIAFGTVALLLGFGLAGPAAAQTTNALPPAPVDLVGLVTRPHRLGVGRRRRRLCRHPAHADGDARVDVSGLTFTDTSGSGIHVVVPASATEPSGSTCGGSPSRTRGSTASTSTTLAVRPLASPYRRPTSRSTPPVPP